MRVRSIIGRFLEHSRIFYFANGAADPRDGDFYIGSADWMERNLSGRIEVVTPVTAPPLRQRLWEILDVNLSDCQQAWAMTPSDDYRRLEPGRETAGPGADGTHAALMHMTVTRGADGRGAVDGLASTGAIREGSETSPARGDDRPPSSGGRRPATGARTPLSRRERSVGWPRLLLDPKALTLVGRELFDRGLRGRTRRKLHGNVAGGSLQYEPHETLSPNRASTPRAAAGSLVEFFWLWARDTMSEIQNRECRRVITAIRNALRPASLTIDVGIWISTAR